MTIPAPIPGAEGDDQRLLRAGRGPRGLLPHGVAVGVVVDRGGDAQSVREQLRERDVAQLAQVGTHVQGAGPIDETRDPHTDGPGARTEGTRQPHQDVDEAGASVRGGDTVLGDDRARVPWIDGHTEHLGAAHVQPHR